MANGGTATADQGPGMMSGMPLPPPDPRGPSLASIPVPPSATAPNAVPAPPPPSDGGIDQPRVIHKTPLEQIGQAAGMLIPGIGTPIERAVQEHYKGRVAQIQMYHQGATALGAALAAGPQGPDGKPTGINPQTGQPMTPEEKQRFQSQYEEAWTRYNEAAGVDKR